MLPFGPVFWHDLRRMSRRQRYRWLCCLLALGMLGALAAIFENQMAKIKYVGGPRKIIRLGLGSDLEEMDPHRLLQAQREAYLQQLVRTGEEFFLVFMVTQWLVLFCLAPAVVAGAIAEEKEKRTVDYLFTTHLTTREIVFGKLLARLWVLFMLTLAGLPVLCMAFTLGGIVPELLWGGILVTLVMMLSLASVSILHSVLARKVRQAILNSYLTIGGYLLGWGVLEVVLKLMRRDGGSMLMKDLLEIYNVGNPFVMVMELRQHFQVLGFLGDKPLLLLVKFLVFHGVVIVGCLAVATLRLRVVCLHDRFRRAKPAAPAASEPVTQEEKPPPRLRRRPPVGSAPLFWKECYAERTFKLGPLGKSITVVSLIALAAPAFVYFMPLALILYAHGKSDLVDEYVRDANAYLRWAGAILVTWIVLAMAVRAATCISSERERQTWESLRSTPLLLERILWAKWFGCWWCVRWLILLFVAICLSISMAGGVHWTCLPLLLAQLFAWGSFFSAWGMWVSARCKSPVTAMTMTVLLLVACSGLPWITEFWEKNATSDEGTFQPWLERLSPSYGTQELCLTKPDLYKEPGVRWERQGRGTSLTVAEASLRRQERVAELTVLGILPFLFLAWGIWWLAYWRLCREGRR